MSERRGRSDKPDTTQKKGEQMVRPYVAYRWLNADRTAFPL
ncbi:hypothetical protein BFO_1737 [Tannerella forsythia 92A2]|uniref:Uncharacterized protein n=1 Tax=Tannerella forsythia (strain ATCC 43037 / JCM 10827 / CCUG 21028 A / KCTC 5666 / FDC 338) TaxID=203275 RepID=G8UN51_TANFA|nr:hypothetical protein BFO_1737 [Tannerella forsythia 92A2]